MSDKPQSPSGERLAKVIARAGVCSRREAEAWITAGRISVNGSPVMTPAFNVIESDAIAVDGKSIARRQPTQLWLYHKPAGLMVTERDPEGRPTVFSEFEKLGLPRMLSIGRLDFNTEGLLLLTNDGGLKRTLELPATGWVRRYRVRAFGSVTQEQLDELSNGITVAGIEYGPIEAVLDSATGSNVWLTVGLREGKNREVRNVLGALGLDVNRLIRLSYGPFQLGDLPTGSVEKVKTRILQDQLGKRLAEAAGADFDPATDDVGQPGQPRRRSPEQPESRPTERDRFGGLRKRPEFKRPERREAEPRTVHFDDGRPAQTFVPSGKPGRRDEPRFGDRPGRDGFKGKRPEGDRPFRERSDRAEPRRFDDRPQRGGEGRGRFDKDDRPFSDRPRKPSDRPFGSGPRRDDRGDRPARFTRPEDGDRPFRAPRPRDGDGGRPQRFNRPDGDGGRPQRFNRPEGEGGRPRFNRSEGEGRGPRRDDDRPMARRSGPPRGDRPFGDRPQRRDDDRPAFKGPRRDGDKPAFKGPRRDGDRPFGDRQPRRDGDKPAFKGPRRDGDRPFGDRPPRRDGDRPAFKGPRRDGDKPAFKGPRRDGDKPFANRPRRDDGPRNGPRPDRPRPPRRPRDE
ncbi:MAG TPA: pseudouridine synthase [Pelagibacterium sp.]|uniref:pseudouridine synthase n=1 Tax=Pelagibacterium sp. TaxID=1967288 RepID=UPI002C1E064C|nr:pseudouridine synthase [Pelagibacterium sp.]HWJ89176.1 pseudouridine synthase [Pelagibacterium sp.]